MQCEVISHYEKQVKGQQNSIVEYKKPGKTGLCQTETIAREESLYYRQWIYSSMQLHACGEPEKSSDVRVKEDN